MKHLQRLLLICIFLAACRPTTGTTAVVETIAGVTPTVNSGCGSGVITPEDVHCYLAATEPSQVQHIDAETAVPTTLPPTLEPTMSIAPTSAPTLEPTPTAEPSPLSEKQTIDFLDPSALIKIPFVRDSSIYLYEDGQEKLVAVPAGISSTQACFSLGYPFLSPDGKFLAYLESAGEPPDEFWGCLRGNLRIVDLATGTDMPISFRLLSFRWTPTNLIQFRLDQEIDEITQQVIEKEIFFNPSSQKELKFVTSYDRDPETFADTLHMAEYPSDQLTQLVRFRDDNYFLINVTTNEETLLFSKDQVLGFLGWSPSGRYVLFETPIQTSDIYDAIEFVVDAQNPSGDPVEIMVHRGAAGGDISTGRKWYFEAAFVPYCQEELYFIDGRSPLQLTNDGGGGCNNEEGFVATSPNGEYALLKFQDRFELHDQQGNIIVVQEVEPILKGRGTPKNFIWLNDDFMAIYQSTFGFRSSEKPTIYLFDRQTNTIEPVIENAYLIEALS